MMFRNEKKAYLLLRYIYFADSYKRIAPMDIEMVLKIEAAEREYLSSRVTNLSLMDGNPYGAKIFLNEKFSCFYVKATSSPMLNRIYGDSVTKPQAILNLLKQSSDYSTVTPLAGPPDTLGQYVHMGEGGLERLRGWTHLQLLCSVKDVVLSRHAFEIEEVTSQTLPEFANIHANGFHTKIDQRELSRASFSAHCSSERMKIYVIRADEEVVAGAVVYFASNGVAYLGTAATSKDARGFGYHGALISHRIEQAKRNGCSWIAATALASSQSRRNLQRAGLAQSHAQALYRLV
jgi:GNAT superfamily N-acetyltransferase